jgi:hypothetical protein
LIGVVAAASCSCVELAGKRRLRLRKRRVPLERLRLQQ